MSLVGGVGPDRGRAASSCLRRKGVPQEEASRWTAGRIPKGPHETGLRETEDQLLGFLSHSELPAPANAPQLPRPILARSPQGSYLAFSPRTPCRLRFSL